jgi:hypothetical protein
MSSITSLCTVIKHEFKDIETKLALLALANKKQCDFIEMLYYILENDTPLFIELFGGQLLKIPTKNEFLKAENSIRLFLYTVAHSDKPNPFICTSYRFGVYMDRVYSNFIDNYEIFIKNKPMSEIELEVTNKDLDALEKMYLIAKESLAKIKDDSSLNKRYSKFSSGNKKKEEQTNNDNSEYDLPNSAMLPEETSDEDAYTYLETEFNYNFDENIDLSTIKEVDDDDEKDCAKQLSLFE